MNSLHAIFSVCNCKARAPLLYVADQPADFVAQFDPVAGGAWVNLFRCPECLQLWRVDVWDKLQTQTAVKVPSQADWESFDSKPLILDSIVQQRGGLSDDTCIRAGCNARAVKTVVYCVEHLFAVGARR